MGVLKRRYVIQPHVLRVLCVPSLLLNDDHRVLTDFFFLSSSSSSLSTPSSPHLLISSEISV